MFASSSTCLKLLSKLKKNTNEEAYDNAMVFVKRHRATLYNIDFLYQTFIPLSYKVYSPNIKETRPDFIKDVRNFISRFGF